MFDQRQIAEFKEAFSMLDHDSDGFLDREDIKDMLASLGKIFKCLTQKVKILQMNTLTI
jgi:Ca2+-binding EF-hand superfamily protein